ncbi:retinol dehydrogenase 16-like isoform X3 [Grus americana]|nr:retinol dehydrogenase 16-like isoform X3 [Grus americana]
MWLYLAAVLAGLYLLWRWHRERQMVPRLSEKYVLITGCDSGFGNLLARQLDARGLRVLAACLTETGAVQLRAATSPRLQTVLLDVTSSQSIAAATAWVRERVGDRGLWGLVNNAGIAVPTAPNEWLTKDDFVKVLNVNLVGLIEVTLSLLPLVKQARGRVVNVASVMGRISFFGGGYCISKHGVEAFSDTLRGEEQRAKAEACEIPTWLPTGGETGSQLEQPLCNQRRGFKKLLSKDRAPWDPPGGRWGARGGHRLPLAPHGSVPPSPCSARDGGSLRRADGRSPARREMRPFGVQVSVIEPGGFRTGMIDPVTVVKGFKQLWERLPAETQASYGHHYLETYAKSTILLHRMSSSCLSRVTGVMAHALLARFPRSRYAAGWDARLAILPLSYCPAWLTDATIGLFLPVPAGAMPTRP